MKRKTTKRSSQRVIAHKVKQRKNKRPKRYREAMTQSKNKTRLLLADMLMKFMNEE